MEDQKKKDPGAFPEEQLDQMLTELLKNPPPQAETDMPSISDADLFANLPSLEELLAATSLAEEAPVEETPMEETPAEEAPAEEAPAEEAPAEEAPAEEAPAEEAPAEEAPAFAAPSEVLPDMTIGESLAPDETETEIGVDEQALEAAGLTVVEPGTIADNTDTPEEPTASIPILISTHTTENPDPKESKPMPELTPAPAEEAEKTYKPRQKIRPKKSGTYGLFSIPHMVAVAIWLAIIVFVGVGLGNIVWAYASDMLAFGRESKSVVISIDAGDDLDDICQRLKDNGLIKYPGLFKIYADLSDAMSEIKPGTYTLNTIYDYMALKNAMSGYAARVTTSVVIPEGYNCQQIFALLEKKGVCTAAALEAAASNGELGEYWFLEGVPRGTANCLEGYLFPDTYQFYLNEEPVSVLKKLLNNFNKRFNDTMKENLATLNETLSELMRKNGMSDAYIAQHQMTIREVVIVASMIEKEAANTSEGYKVSSVIYNRLTNPNAYPHLQIDAALVYVTGNPNITMDDLALDSPYNTYKNPGLIPGPISNPSRASLDAALEPAYDETHSDGSIIYYYYYALNPETGEHKFSETLAEHDAFLDSLKKNEEETP